ncbi:MAG: GDSL-type esterase/lipase family protein [Deltaproteobacteria bacterium]|nr:GDSL-type esterase/lipase family protein [Deltaproteobacteria bacterium]
MRERFGRACLLAAGMMLGAAGAWGAPGDPFLLRAGADRAGLLSAFAFVIGLLAWYVVEPKLWRRALGADEDRITRTFFLHAWPIILWLPFGTVLRRIPAETFVYPAVLFLAFRTSGALSRRPAADDAARASSAIPSAALLVVASPAVVVMAGMPLGAWIVGAFLLTVAMEALFFREDRKGVIFWSCVGLLPFAAVRLVRPTAGDPWLLGTALIYVAGLYLTASIHKHRATAYAPVMWAITLSAAFFAEGVLRTADVEVRLRPREVGRTMEPDDALFFVPAGFRQGVREADFDRLEFRSGGTTKTKPDGVFRIVCVGGSSTYGIGVEPSAVWPAVLEAMLKSAGYRVEVINAGIPGYRSFQIFILLRDFLLEYEPDAVLMYAGFNDLNHRAGPYTDREVWRMMQGQSDPLHNRIARWQARLSQSRLYAALRLTIVEAWRRVTAVSNAVVPREEFFGESHGHSPPTPRPRDSLSLHNRGVRTG